MRFAGDDRPQPEANQEQSRAYQFSESSLRNAEAIQAMGMSRVLLARWHKLHKEIKTIGNKRIDKLGKR